MAAYTVGKVMLFFLLILILGLSIGNAVYFARMSETEEADPKVSKSSAYTWMWINIVIIVVVLIGCFSLGYFIYNDLKSPEKKKVKVIIDEDFVGIDIENEYTKRKKELEKQAKDMEDLVNEREAIQSREIAKRSVRKLQKLAQLNLEPEVFLEKVREIESEQKSEVQDVIKNSATKRGYLKNIYKVEGSVGGGGGGGGGRDGGGGATDNKALQQAQQKLAEARKKENEAKNNLNKNQNDPNLKKAVEQATKNKEDAEKKVSELKNAPKDGGQQQDGGKRKRKGRNQ